MDWSTPMIIPTALLKYSESQTNKEGVNIDKTFLGRVEELAEMGERQKRVGGEKSQCIIAHMCDVVKE